MADETEPAGDAASRDEAGEDMHVHKPKAVHDWRAFASEIGIIVIGVLIALAFEQTVEWMHWRHLVAEHRTALNQNVEDMEVSKLTRVDLQPCADARLADIATILKRHAANQPLGVTGPVGRVTASVAQMGPFDMALSDQAFAHMPLAEQEKYFEARGTYSDFREVTTREREAWQILGSLDRVATFTPADWTAVANAYDRAVDLNDILKNDLTDQRAGQWLWPFRPFPKPKNATLRFIPRVRQLCQPMIERTPG